MPLLAFLTTATGLFKAGQSLWYKVKKPVPQSGAGLTETTQAPTQNNTIMYIFGGAILLLLGYSIIKK